MSHKFSQICSRLRVPLIQAPMSGGINSPKFAAAVASSGAIGSFGFASSTPEKIHEDLKQTKALTDGVINANFFLYPENLKIPEKTVTDTAISYLKQLPYYQNVPLDVKVAPPPYNLKLSDQLDPVWEHKPDLLTFHFGVPPPDIIKKANDLGICVGINATSITEALEVEKYQADFIIAQGIEAGGHRGVHYVNFPNEAYVGIRGGLKTVDLVRAIRAITDTPIVAAGGIMNGYDIREIINGGATLAQLGTAFVVCQESGASESHKEWILSKHDRETAFTRGVSGRYAQGIRTKFTEHYAKVGNLHILPFPLQNRMTAVVRDDAVARGDGEYQNLWAGVNFTKARGGLDAAQLVKLLEKEYNEVKA